MQAFLRILKVNIQNRGKTKAPDKTNLIHLFIETHGGRAEQIRDTTFILSKQSCVARKGNDTIKYRAQQYINRMIFIGHGSCYYAAHIRRGQT